VSNEVTQFVDGNVSAAITGGGAINTYASLKPKSTIQFNYTVVPDWTWKQQ
jgi:hypothetical protein